MKRKYIIIITFLLLAFLVVYFTTRRTPYTVAEIVSGLEITKKNKVEVFEDDWGVTGDGLSIIVFKLHSEVINELSEQCINENFKQLPIREDLPLNTIYNYLNQLDTIGYYRFVVDDDGMSYNVVVLDLNKEKLIVINELF